MRAALLTEQRPRLELAEVDEPRPGSGEVRLRVTACGICGSDLHAISAMAEPGTILGHEIAGVVDAVGPGVQRWRLGDPVTGRPFYGCGACRHCTAGRHDHCAEFALVGFQRPGGFAEAVVLRDEELFALPTALPPQEQALVEPLAVARRALRRGGLRPGEDLAILGGGPIGLAVLAWARALGAGRVVVSDPVASRRQLALDLGADSAVDPTAEDPASTTGTPPLVVECSGAPGVIDQAMQLADVDGRVAVVGICLAHDTLLPWWGITKELDVRFSAYYGREDFTETIDALEQGKLSAGAMVLEQVDLECLVDRFHELVADPGDGKTVIVPTS